MPPPEQANLDQVAVLWVGSAIDEHGEVTLGTPVEINVRWNNKRVESLDSRGNPIGLDATVVVDIDILAGSLMWLGTLEEYYSVGSAGDDTAIMVVKTFKKIPDMKQQNYYREVGLSRYKDSPV